MIFDEEPQKTAVRQHLPAPTKSCSPSSTQKEKEHLDTPNVFTSTLPLVKAERKTEKEKKGGVEGRVK